MATDDEHPDDLRVRLTWPQTPAGEDSPFDYADDPAANLAAGDLTPAAGTRFTPPLRPPVGRGTPDADPNADHEQDASSRRPIGRWAVGRRAAAQRAAQARANAARAAAERVVAQRAAEQRREAQRFPASTPEAMDESAEREQARRLAEQAEVRRLAEQAEARRLAEQAEARRLAEQAEAQRAAAERAAAQQAAAERAAADRAAAEAAARQAEARAAEERAAAAERALAEREATERAARADAERAARADAERAARADAERAARADAERAARADAERAAREAADRAEAEREARRAAERDDHTRRRPLLTVDAEDAEDDEDDGPRRHEAHRPTATTQELILAGRSDSLQAALASIALRIDALTSTTSTFRNLISDRITDYAEQVGRLAAGAAGDLDDYRHVHERALEQIRRSVGDAEDNIRRVGRSVGDLDAKVGALVAAVRESGDAVDQIVTERDQVSDSLVRSVARVEDALTELTEGKGATSLARLGEMTASLTGDRDRQAAVLAQLEQLVVSLADDREHESDVLARLERSIAELTVGRERGLAKALSRLEARIEEVANSITGLSGDELGATLARLDARLREMTTELVVGRDRETAKALAQLSAQVDGIAGLVAEGRTDLSPIESRLNRLARSTPQAAPVDLAGLYTRLDELADVVARGGAGPGASGAISVPQDRQELLERFDQLGQQLGEQLEGLRRRIALRARTTAPGLDDATIAAIADAVVARLQGVARPRPSPARATAELGRPISPSVVDEAPEWTQRGREPWRT